MSALENINKIEYEFDTAVILAGGKSTRMGFDKQFLEINNNRLLESLIAQLKLEFKEIIIVTNKMENYTDFDCKVICDEIKEIGPLGGIHIALKESKSKYTYFLACDMPNIDLEYIKSMKNSLKDKDIDAYVNKNIDGKIEPFNGFYNKRVINQIEINLSKGDKSLMYLIKSLNTFYMSQSDVESYKNEMFLNLNTKEDLNKYIESLKQV